MSSSYPPMRDPSEALYQLSFAKSDETPKSIDATHLASANLISLGIRERNNCISRMRKELRELRNQYQEAQLALREQHDKDIGAAYTKIDGGHDMALDVNANYQRMKEALTFSHYLKMGFTRKNYLRRQADISNIFDATRINRISDAIHRLSQQGIRA